MYITNFQLALSVNFLLVSFPLIILLFFISSVIRFSKEISTLFIAVSLFIAGILVTNLAFQHRILPNYKANYSGIVLTNTETREKSNRVECLLTQFSCADENKRISEKVVVYYKNYQELKSPEIGDSVFIKTIIKPVKPNINPGEFDYSKYLKNKCIYYTIFADSGNIYFGSNTGSIPIRRMAGKIQKAIQESFRKYEMTGPELAVLTALFAGDRSLIDQETNNSYIATGAVHILSVSGMHVGILYLFISLLLGRKKRSNRIVIVRLIVLILTIWFYAFITGLSPSVIRASVMFSLFTLGKSFDRQINSYNIIAASAFLILIFNPLILFDVGFQLSYMAVLGIIYFQPRITNLFLFNTKVGNWIWQLTAMGIAAQLATFPLTLFYFHQFPSLFWLSNLAAVPLVWLIMMGTIIFFIFLPFTFLAHGIANLVDWLVQLMNSIISRISRLPGAVITGIDFGWTDLIFYSIAIIGCLVIYQSGKRKSITLFLLASVAIYNLSGFIQYKVDDHKREFIVYNLNQGMAYSIIDGHKHLFIANSAVFNNYTGTCRQLQNFWMSRDILKTITAINIDTLSNYSTINLEYVNFIKKPEGYFLQQGSDLYFFPLFRKEDRIISKDRHDSFGKYRNTWSENSFDTNDLSLIILSGNHAAGYSKKWEYLANIHHVAIYNTEEEGSYRILLNHKQN